MGTRGVGMAGFFSLALIWLYGGFADAPEMLAYSYVWMIAVLYRKLTPDPRQHTQYQGAPLLTGWLFGNEMTARLAEAGLMWIAGGILSGLSPALGRFVTFGTVSLGMKYVFDAAILERQKEAAHNAIVEMSLQQQRMQEVTRR